MSDKIKLFYSEANTNYLIKSIYQTERAHPAAWYVERVPEWMRTWNGIASYDSYESLVHDPTEELIAINQDFLREHIRTHTSVTPKLETVDDYRTHDIQRMPELRTAYNGNFRANNAIPQWQLYGKRTHAVAEHRGRSLGTAGRPMMKMDEYYANATRAERPVREHRYER